MDVNAAIIDSRVSALTEDIRERVQDELAIKGDETKLRSVAFVFLCVSTLLDLDFDVAFDCLVEGGQDFGVDAIHITEERDGEFTATLVQGKYSKKLDGSSGFPATGIEKLVQAVRHLFNPSSTLQAINSRLNARVEEVRSMIRDGYIPQVRVIACNNGKIWETNGAETIELAGFGDQVTWEYVNHDRLVEIINGGQTCMTIYRTLAQRQQELQTTPPPPASVLVRLYQLPSDNDDRALRDLYGERDISLQQLAATFRRGDLIDRLEKLEISA